VLDLVGAIDGTNIGPFAYGVSERRGKWSLTVTSPFGDGDATLSSKLDVSPPVWLDPVWLDPVWLDPVWRGWAAMPVHATYGTRPLPELLRGGDGDLRSRPGKVTVAQVAQTYGRLVGDPDQRVGARVVCCIAQKAGQQRRERQVLALLAQPHGVFDGRCYLLGAAGGRVDLADVEADQGDARIIEANHMPRARKTDLR
jgi:hypothetical protein